MGIQLYIWLDKKLHLKRIYSNLYFQRFWKLHADNALAYTNTESINANATRCLLVWFFPVLWSILSWKIAWSMKNNHPSSKRNKRLLETSVFLNHLIRTKCKLPFFFFYLFLLNGMIGTGTVTATPKLNYDPPNFENIITDQY